MSDRGPVNCGLFSVQRTTNDAVLVVDCDGDEYWIPKSQICEESDINNISEDGEEGDLVIPEWLAIEKGLV